MFNLIYNQYQDVFSKSYLDRSRKLEKAFSYFTNVGNRIDSNDNIEASNIQRYQVLQDSIHGYMQVLTQLLNPNNTNQDKHYFLRRYKQDLCHHKLAQKIFGYKHGPTKLLFASEERKTDVVYEILTVRLKSFLANMLDKDIDKYMDDDSQELQKDVRILILNLAQCGYKNFSGLKLFDLDLSGYTFVGCSFIYSAFSESDLSNTTFENCIFDFTSFYSTNLEGCKIKNSKISTVFFDSKHQSSEIMFESNYYIDKYFGYRDINGASITKNMIYSLQRNIARYSPEKIDSLEKAVHSTDKIILECPISLEIVPLRSACAVIVDNSGVRLYNTDKLWRWFKENPKTCPMRNPIKNIKFMSLQQLLKYLNLTIGG